MVDQVVTVNQHIAKGNDLRKLRDGICGAWVYLRQALDGLADDFEVALYGLTQQAITAVLRQ